MQSVFTAGNGVLAAVSNVMADSALVKMVKHASGRANASYLDWWRRPGFLEMVLPSRLRHVLDEGGGYIGGGGKDDVPMRVENMAAAGDFPLPADLIVGSIVACIIMSVIRLVIDRVRLYARFVCDSSAGPGSSLLRGHVDVTLTDICICRKSKRGGRHAS